MNVIHLIWAELKAIVAKPHNIVVMVAVMCIPLLYAGMFLYGFWDAFGKTGQLPVAVVNQDSGAEIAGRQLHAGDDLVDNLKKDDNFKWSFVSEKKAEDGFKDNHYFMTVRIPSSFSENATTLSDQKVRPANIEYRINRDYNFISGKMADTGIKNLQTRISDAITKTYAKTMYTQIDKLTDGLADASKGANDLSGGGKSELAGLNQLKSGFKDLANGTGQLTDGSEKLTGGASELNDGAKTLNSGVQQYTGAVSNQIAPGSNQLASGLNQLNSGIQQQNLGGNVNRLNSGMQDFYAIIQGLPQQIDHSINPAQIGNTAMQQVAGNKTEIQSAARKQVKNNEKQIIQSAQSSINHSEVEAAALAAANSQPGGTIQEQADANASKITKTISDSVKSQATIDQVTAGLNNNKQLNQLLLSLLNKAGYDPHTSKAVINNLYNVMAQSTTSTIGESVNSGKNTNAIASSLQTSAEETIKKTASGTAQRVAPAAAVATAEQIAPETALSTAQQVSRQTATETAAQMKSGVIENMQQKDPRTGLTLNSAARQLADGTAQLSGRNGIPLITSSVSQATQGAQTLNSGLNQLNSNSASLANGSSALAGNTGKLANGAASLTNGLSGLSSGQQQLSNGTNKVAGGAQQIYKGNSKLAGSLSDAHSQLAETPTDDSHAQKFSEPVRLIDSSNQAVDTFGSGFTPYFICIGLFVGALVLTLIYDLGKPAGLATAGWNIALSKYFITILMSVAQALLVDLAVLGGLGLSVDHPWTFIGFTILTSMSFMAIIQWLAGSFNNEGRFVALVILLFQLVTSGGAYSIELIPGWLQKISPILPMTYAVNGFRNIIDGGQHQMLVNNSIALLVFILVGLLLSIITFSIKFHRDQKNNKAGKLSGSPMELSN
ncbi:YhgE/Pip family protein [Sporolactobacillus sp. THM19-2]|uniref:YhgE/Pip family protein n=1 Tax=Sporolactobacillus sp. THM19-2 TaxID=2511171 RepID=UPI0010215707|nr:YhgE/Pip domain-containing protein [Sporolactobacillus sp. THM19-2]RYL91520.1 YhgE/Pip domain-containing protein [Sporolactobacillus sp. THM19-2]